MSHMHEDREYRIKQYPLERGALEIQYIEEFFGEFDRKKTADEILARLSDRIHCILMTEAHLPDDPSQIVPVSFKVSHELYARETDPKLRDLFDHVRDTIDFDGRRILYSWIGGTRSDWRGQGFFRALTEQQEVWAFEHGFKEILVKTKNKFYGMRGTLDHLHFEVIKFERSVIDNRESKVYLSKKVGPDILKNHLSTRTLVDAIN